MIDSFSDEQIDYLLSIDESKLRETLLSEKHKRDVRKTKRQTQRRKRVNKRKRAGSPIRVKIENIGNQNVIPPVKIEPCQEPNVVDDCLPPPKKKRVTNTLYFSVEAFNIFVKIIPCIWTQTIFPSK